MHFGPQKMIIFSNKLNSAEIFYSFINKIWIYLYHAWNYLRECHLQLKWRRQSIGTEMVIENETLMFTLRAERSSTNLRCGRAKDNRGLYGSMESGNQQWTAQTSSVLWLHEAGMGIWAHWTTEKAAVAAFDLKLQFPPSEFLWQTQGITAPR